MPQDYFDAVKPENILGVGRRSRYRTSPVDIPATRLPFTLARACMTILPKPPPPLTQAWKYGHRGQGFVLSRWVYFLSSLKLVLCVRNQFKFLRPAWGALPQLPLVAILPQWIRRLLLGPLSPHVDFLLLLKVRRLGPLSPLLPLWP